MKNIKKIAECQQVSERKKRKGQIARASAVFVSFCQQKIFSSSTDDKHMLGRELASHVSRFTERKLRALDNRFRDIAHGHHADRARAYQIRQGNYRNPKTISRHTTEMEKLGMIEVRQTFREVNAYQLGSYLKDEIIRNYLVKYFPSLRLFVGISLLMSFNGTSGHFVPLSFKKYLNNNCSYNIKSMRKRELIMIKSLELTDAGKINLSVFPQSAIAIADNKLIKTLQKGVSVANPFEFLCKIAHAWCKENNIQPEYRAMFQALELEGITKTAPKFTRILISKAMATNTYAYQQAAPEKKHNPIPNFGREGACCYYQSADNETKRIYLKKQMGAYKLDENGTPIPLCRLTLDKLTCHHN